MHPNDWAYIIISGFLKAFTVLSLKNISDAHLYNENTHLYTEFVIYIYIYIDAHISQGTFIDYMKVTAKLSAIIGNLTSRGMMMAHKNIEINRKSQSEILQ